MNSFVYGSKRIFYKLNFSERKTMEIAVHPDGSVVVKAPVSASLESIERKLRKRARWILKQLNYFDQFNPRTPKRRYVGGETHLYLGKQYRLKLIKAKTPNVKLTNGFFIVSIESNKSMMRIQQLMDQWYKNKAISHFDKIFNQWWHEFKNTGVKKPHLQVKYMKNRWGSLSNKGMLSLNPDLMKAPRECIDYVVLHELCHLKYNDHSTDFYKLLDKVLPDWEKRKHKLELVMA
jgi:predicted metal-dependent hydrolase